MNLPRKLSGFQLFSFQLFSFWALVLGVWCLVLSSASQNEIVSAQEHSAAKFLAQLIHHTSQPLRSPIFHLPSSIFELQSQPALKRPVVEIGELQ